MRPDAATAALHDLSIVLPAIDRAAYYDKLTDGAEGRALLAAERKRALDQCGRADERRERLLEQHREEDEEQQRRISWLLSSTGRLIHRLTGDDSLDGLDGPRFCWTCPRCQPDADADADDMLVIEHRYRRGGGDRNVVRAACLGGCEPAALAEACRRLVVDREAEARSAALDREAQDVAAELAPRAIEPSTSRWIIPDLLPAEALSLVVAPSGGSKTWMLIAMAVAVASGRPLLGREVRRGRVLLCLLESHAINYARIDLLARGLGTSLDELRAGGWLDVWPLGTPLKTDDPASIAKLARAVRARRYAAILVDNASEIRSSLAQSSENDSTVIGAAMRPLAQLAHDGALNGERVVEVPPAIAVLHHAGGSGAARGSTAFLQHADFVLEMRARSQAPESPITIALGDGCRVATARLPVAMRFSGIEPASVAPELVEARPAKQAEAEPDVDPRHEALLAALRAHAADTGGGASLNEAHRRAGGSKRDVGPALRRMEALGLAELRSDALWYAVE
ncbi:MAG: AAA family ATPase [Deltaproteobacteria bacterium]|nr:AAA family ATPase [Deltaproteobacteria bacterium]